MIKFATVPRKIISNSLIHRQRLYHISQCLQSNDSDVLLEKALDPKIKQLYDRHESDILYSSVYEKSKLNLGFVRTKMLEHYIKTKEEKVAAENVNVKPFSIALKYWDDSKADFDEKAIADASSAPSQWKDDLINDLAYKKRKLELLKEMRDKQSAVVDKEEQEPFLNDWMNDYEIFDDSESSTHSEFGTPDPSVPVSKIPCYGCGALLQCADSSLPGYLPSELYKGRSDAELKVTGQQKI